MNYSVTSTTAGKIVVANDDYACIPHKFDSNAKAGDIVEGVGVVLNDVTVANNPNGSVIYRGVIDESKLEEDQKPTTAQVTALPLIKWLKSDGTFDAGKA